MQTTYESVNKSSWDLRTSIHVSSDFYDVPNFLTGRNTLNKPELSLLSNVEAKKLLHLQCHFGLDTLSWARLGAQVTGIDFSAQAISEATKLSSLAKVQAEFIEADVLNLYNVISESSYDIVFTSYGVLCWLSDLERWADNIRYALKPGGQLVLVEFHPFLDILFPPNPDELNNYFHIKEPKFENPRGTYTNHQAPIQYSQYRWQYALQDVIKATSKAGFIITDFNEYPYCPFKLYPDLELHADGLWYPKKGKYIIPYLFSIVAQLP